MSTPAKRLPLKEKAHNGTIRIKTTLYEVIEAISDETTEEEDNLVYLTVDSLVRKGRLNVSLV